MKNLNMLCAGLVCLAALTAPSAAQLSDSWYSAASCAAIDDDDLDIFDTYNERLSNSNNSSSYATLNFTFNVDKPIEAGHFYKTLMVRHKLGTNGRIIMRLRERRVGSSSFWTPLTIDTNATGSGSESWMTSSFDSTTGYTTTWLYNWDSSWDFDFENNVYTLECSVYRGTLSWQGTSYLTQVGIAGVH